MTCKSRAAGTAPPLPKGEVDRTERSEARAGEGLEPRRQGAKAPSPAFLAALGRRPLPAGERWVAPQSLGRSVRQIVSNTPSRFSYTSALVTCTTWKPSDFEYARTLRVSRDLACFTVRRAVDLYDQPAVERDEIDDVSVDRMLATKFPAFEPSIPKRAP